VSDLSPAAVTHLRQLLVTPRLPERYRLLRELGRGATGVVWAAHDDLLDRDVAIKVLAEHHEGDALAARMQREARTLARLEHPGIAPVHDAGTLDDGRPWYAMRLVRGRSLRDAAPEIATQGQALRLVMQIAETIAFAHAQGILHRDLTPANVMLGPFGEVVVLDWGVGILGTPGYAAPEQAAGASVDGRSDVYGLGAILRDLLAGGREPVPAPLKAVLDRALAPDAGGRYPDPLAFRDDLGRHLDGRPVLAYRERPWDTVARLVRQHRTAIALVGAYLVMRLVVLLWRGV
jgi:serine/threonine protein kinase